MTPYYHAVSSAKKFGGTPEDYVEIHDWFDETKVSTGKWTHRALRHHSMGIQWAIEKFGHSIGVVAGGGVKRIPVKLIAEQHVTEDCGFIPTPEDYLKHLEVNPDPWMLRVQTTSAQVLKE